MLGHVGEEIFFKLGEYHLHSQERPSSAGRRPRGPCMRSER